MVIWIAIVCSFLFSCNKDSQVNDPYIIEETEVEYAPPAPYYDEKDYEKPLHK